VFLARHRARMRRRGRLWRARLQKFSPAAAEKQLFGPWVRYLEGRCLERYHEPPFRRRSRDRAARLLANRLTSSQRRCLRRYGFFNVRGSSGRGFRVWARRQLPVELIDLASPEANHQPWLYCVHSECADDGSILPLADYLLELKLCLEANEEHFLVTSNPNFENGYIEKYELLKAARESSPMTDPIALEWLAAAEGLASEWTRTRSRSSP
jgi:hypothetical protein